MQGSARSAVYTKLHLLAVAGLVLFISWMIFLQPAQGLNYSAGTYGTCQYGTCGISLATSGSIAVDVIPVGGSTRCTVTNDVVTVTTNASTGYTVSLTNTDTSSTLNGPVSISASSGTPASPSSLTSNTWGYRVDGVAGFGSGPTSSATNGTIPAQAYAGVPISSGSPGLIRTTPVVDPVTVNTSVWYGVCADSTLQSGSYSDSVTYTAVIN
jgi:hypothetical protein